MLPDKLQGDRLTLASLAEHHVDQGYYEWMNDTDVTRYLEARHKTWSKDELIAYIADMNADKVNYLFGIFDENGVYIGNIKLGPVIGRDKRASIGLMIGKKEAWGKGYGLEAVKLIAKFGFDQLGLHKLTAGCYGSHSASKKIFLKAGFTIEGCMKHHIYSDGEYEDMIVFGLLKEGVF